MVDEESHQWAWLCEGEALKEPDPNSDTKERIIEALQTHPNTALQASEILELIGGSIHTIRRSCFQLAMDGIIGRRKSETNARAWVYFLKWEGDGSDHLVEGSDHLGMITLPFRNDAGFDGSDHASDQLSDHIDLLPKRSFYSGCTYQYGDRVHFSDDYCKHPFWIIGAINNERGKQLIIQDNSGVFFRPVKPSEVVLF